MQLVGRPFAEATLHRLGQAFQDLTDFHRRRPPILDATPDAGPDDGMVHRPIPGM